MMGIDYNMMLDRDIRYYTNCVNGYISRREVEMTDAQTVGHIVAGKIAQAVWGDKEFIKALKPIKLRDDPSEKIKSRNEKVMRTLKAKGVI